MTSSRRTGARILVDQLLVHGGHLAFGVPGESYLAVLEAMRESGDGFRFIVCRHEASAANMAEAAGKLTAAPGLCFVTRGPGATQGSVGLHTARHDSTPMIMFIGQIPRGVVGREAFQEIDYRLMFGEVSKRVIVVDQTERIPELISKAYHTAVNGRPGPVVVVLPEDVLTAEAEVADALPYRKAEAAPTPESMREFAALAGEAKRPLILLGGSGWTPQARHDIARFAEAWRIPVTVGFRRQDLFDNRHPLYAGDVGLGVNPSLAAKVREADVLIAVGTRMSETVSGDYTLVRSPTTDQRLVHVLTDPDELGRVYSANLPIVSSPDAFAAAAAGLDAPDRSGHIAWAEELRQIYLANVEPEPTDEAVDLGQVVKSLSDSLPRNAIVCNGAGNYATWLHRFFQYGTEGAQLAPTSGAMGYGFPAGIAAKLVRPDAPVVVFAGDGCFMMAVAELTTAVRYGLSLVVVVVNNGSYGTIRMHQERHYPGQVYATDLINPDFVALAKACGAHAELVGSTAEFAPAYDRAAAAGRPALIEVRTTVNQLTPRLKLSDLKPADPPA